MLNLKNNLYFAGVLALCILAACSSEAPSTAGSTTIPNASAQNDSIIFEGDKPIIPYHPMWRGHSVFPNFLRRAYMGIVATAQLLPSARSACP